MNERRWKQGDVREDGMVFWQYHTECQGGEYWVTTEKYTQNKDSRRAYDKAYGAAYRASFSERIRAENAAYNVENREKIKLNKLAYRLANGEKIRANHAAYYLANKEKIRAYHIANQEKTNAYLRTRRAADGLLTLCSRFRSRTRIAFNQIGISKSARTEELLGCPWRQAKAHIEKQFTRGMGWHNLDKWHIDHIIPLSSAYDEYTLTLLCHYTNIRPLWAKDNRAKSDNYFPPEYCI